MSWIQFEESLIGKVTHPIKNPVQYGLTLDLGDTVIIKSQNMDWYYGYSLMKFTQDNSMGIFPINYVKIIGKDEIVLPNDQKDNNEYLEVLNARMMTTLSVHESIWISELKRLYKENYLEETILAESSINKIVNLFFDIMKFSNNKEKLLKIYDHMWIGINKVNSILNIDFTLEKKTLSILRVTDLPVASLEKLYIENSNQIKVLPVDFDEAYNLETCSTNSQTSQLCDLIITMNNFEFLGVTDELVMEWLIVDLSQNHQFEHFWLPIQETRKGKPKWKDDKFIFKEVPLEIRKEGFVAVYVYRIGHLVTDPNKQLTCKFRRPIAFGSFSIKEFQPDNEKVKINLFNLNEMDFLKSTSELIKMKMPAQVANKYVQVTLETSNPIESQFLEFDDKHTLESIYLSNDSPNKSDKHFLYVRLRGAEFDRANKKSAKNVEAQLSVKDSNGRKLECILSNPNSNNKTDYFSSVTYHSNSPKWNDLIKIDLDPVDIEESYIYIEFFHCTTKDKKGDERKYFACCFLQLKRCLEGEKNENSFVIRTKKNFIIPKKLNQLAPIVANDPDKNLSKELCNLTLILCSTELSSKNSINDLILKKSKNFQISNLWQFLEEVQTITNKDFLKPKLRKSIMEMIKYVSLSSSAQNNEKLTIELFITSVILFDKHIKWGLREELSCYLNGEYRFIESLLNGIKSVFQNAIKLNISSEILAMAMNSMEPVFMILSQNSELEFQYQISERIKEILKWNVELFEGNYTSDPNYDIRKFIFESTNENLKHIRNLTSIDVLCEYLKNLFKSKDFLNEKILPKEKFFFIDQLLKSGIIRNCLDIMVAVFHPIVAFCTNFIDISSQHILSVAEILLQLFIETKSLLQQERIELFSNKIMQRFFIQTFMAFTSKQNKQIQKNMHLFRRESEASILNRPISIRQSFTNVEFIPEFEKLYTLLFCYLEEWYIISNADISVSDIHVVLNNLKRLLESEIYPKNWLSVYLKISNISLNILDKVGEYIETLTTETHIRLIQTFLEACFVFMMQDCLKLEKFPYGKQMKIIEKYEDMRIEVMERFLNVCLNKSAMIRNFDKSFALQMLVKIFHISLLQVSKIRINMVPFFGHIIALLLDKCNDKHELCQEVIPEIEKILCEGYGDEEYHIFLCNFGQQNIPEDVSEIVNVVGKLLDLHLENRKIANQTSKVVHQEFLLFSFMMFYKEEVNIHSLFIYYSDKFSQLLEQEGHKLEAAMVLKMQFDTMPWNEETVPFDTIFFENFTGTNTEVEKRNLGNKMINLLVEMQEFEEACLICDNFIKHYISTFNYKELSSTLKRMSELYELIITESRLNIIYYRIKFIGGALPRYMRHSRDYIFKCSIWFKSSDLKEMLKNDFPDAEIKLYQSKPPIEPTYEHKMIIYIAKMDPIPFDLDLNRNRNIHTKIRNFFKDHNICNFSSNHFFHKGEVDKENEVKTVNVTRYEVMTETMPSIFMWTPIINETIRILNPIEVATETILKKNKNFEDLIDEYNENLQKDLNPFSMLLQGTLDAGVNGGLNQYIKAFFSESSSEEFEIMQIKDFKDALVEQKGILSTALTLHKKLMTPAIMQLHERLEECFKSLSDTIENVNVFKVRSISSVPTLDNVYHRLNSISVKPMGLNKHFSEKSSFFQEDIRISDTLSWQFNETNNRSSDDCHSSNGTMFQKSRSGSEKSLIFDAVDQCRNRRKVSSADEEQLQKLAEEQAYMIRMNQKLSNNPSSSSPDINMQFNDSLDDNTKLSLQQTPPLPPENETPFYSPKKEKKNNLIKFLRSISKKEHQNRDGTDGKRRHELEKSKAFDIE